MEVYIIGKLNHDNVIRSVQLPPHLHPPPGDPPVLAMEFCEGGDLRKVTIHLLFIIIQRVSF